VDTIGLMGCILAIPAVIAYATSHLERFWF
jgi:hypothetical protein